MSAISVGDKPADMNEATLASAVVNENASDKISKGVRRANSSP